MVSRVTSESLVLPAVYGATGGLLAWQDIHDRLATALHYWVVTVRPNGRPHSVPVDGLWIDDELSFGGSDETIRHRNLLARPDVVVHLADPNKPVIVEGTCSLRTPAQQAAEFMVNAAKDKYGYAPPISAYLSGVWTLTPNKVMAWHEGMRAATAFRFVPADI